METTLGVYVDNDDALLQWSVDEIDGRTKGFAVQRELTRGHRTVRSWLENFAAPGKKEHQDGSFARSDKRPFRTFAWTDHSVDRGDVVRYRVMAVLEAEDAPSEDLASEWSDAKTLGGGESAFQPFFNRGFLISQF